MKKIKIDKEKLYKMGTILIYILSGALTAFTIGGIFQWIGLKPLSFWYFILYLILIAPVYLAALLFAGTIFGRFLEYFEIVKKTISYAIPKTKELYYWGRFYFKRIFK